MKNASKSIHVEVIYYAYRIVDIRISLELLLLLSTIYYLIFVYIVNLYVEIEAERKWVRLPTVTSFTSYILKY